MGGSCSPQIDRRNRAARTHPAQEAWLSVQGGGSLRVEAPRRRHASGILVRRRHGIVLGGRGPTGARRGANGTVVSRTSGARTAAARWYECLGELHAVAERD